jgi:hemoglobin
VLSHSGKHRTAFLADYSKAAVYLRTSTACLGYAPSQCEEEVECFILRIIWQSATAHLGNFKGSEEFRRFLPLIKLYIPFVEETRHYAPTDINWSRW